MKRPRIVLADDHSIILTGVRSLIGQDCELVGTAGDGRSLVDLALKVRADLIILDIGMPLLNGIDAAKQILKAWPDAKLLFLTMHTNPMYLREAMNAGASGYVLKSSATELLRPAIRKVLKGETYITPAFGPQVVEGFRTATGRRPRSSVNLTDRQREVLQLIAEGKTNKEVATILKVSVKTVEFHRGQMMRKLGVHTVAELAAFAVREGLVSILLLAPSIEF